MNTKHRAATRQLLLFLLFVSALVPMTIGCGGYNSSGGGSAPYISGLSVSAGAAGTPVTVTGNYFGATQGSSTVTFNGTAATPTSWSNTSIVVPVPAGATSGPVVVTVGGKASNGATFTVTSASAPTITNLSPNSGPVGTSVTITGTNFGSTQGSSTVLFYNRIAATTVTSWSATSIVVTVPSGATTGNVVVTVNGVASNGVNFTVTASSASAGWTWIQENPALNCTGSGKTSCTIGIGYMTPTVAGSVWVVSIQTPSNVTITNVIGGGGTWAHCPNCHVTNPSGFNADAWYNLSGNAGTNQGITLTLSGSAGNFLQVLFFEVLPPPGTTASFDTSGIAAPTSCTTCTGPSLSLSGTDAVLSNTGGGSTNWNACAPPFTVTWDGGCYALNVSGSVTETKTFVSAVNPEFWAIAFSSSAGSFTPPAPQYSAVNFTPIGGLSCGTCTLTIPSTGAGHLLYVEAVDESGNSRISSISGAGTWVVPSGANTCQIQQVVGSTDESMSCAYNLSTSAGATSLSVTMSGSGSTNFGVWEISTSIGSFQFDTQGSQAVASSGQFYFTGQHLTITGANDVVFQMGWEGGGLNGASYYPMPSINYNPSTLIGPGNYLLTNEASMAVLLNTGPSAPTPVWSGGGNTQNTTVSGIAFTAR